MIGFSQGDQKWHEYRRRAVSDLYWFNEVVLGLGDKIPMRPAVHSLLCRFVEKRTGSPALDECRYRKIEMPRETGKSTLITQGYAIQRICQDPNVAILICNEKETLAKDFLSAIKFQFENNDLLRALFPEVIPPDMNATTWSGTRIVVNRTSGRPDPTVDIIGVGGTITGKHPDLILVDDMISREAMENARAGSWQIMHQTNRWIHQLEPIVNKGAKPFPEIIFIGTRWWHNDCYEHIEEAYGYGEDPRNVLLRINLPETAEQQQVMAYRVGDIAVFRRSAIEDGRSIFPEKWDLEKLAKMRTIDPELFACNMMNQPSDEVTATFKSAWLQHFTWLDDNTFYFTTGEAKREVLRVKDLDIIILVDPGGFGQKQVEDRARAAIWVLGDDLQGHRFLLDCYAEKDTYLAAIRKLVEFCLRYPTVRKVYIERAGQQAAFSQLVRLEFQKAGVNTYVDGDTLKPGVAQGGGNKDLRILEMEPYFQRGEVWVGTSPAFHEFKTQYSQWPRAKRVDLLDLLGYWPRLMRKTAHNQRPEERRAQELAIYRSKRRWR